MIGKQLILQLSIFAAKLLSFIKCIFKVYSANRGGHDTNSIGTWHILEIVPLYHYTKIKCTATVHKK